MMQLRSGAVVVLFLLSSASSGAETTSHASLNVAVHVLPVATIAVQYASGDDIVCRVPQGASGFVACEGSAMISGAVRTTALTRGVQLELGQAPAGVQLRCAGQTVAPGGACASWTAPWVGRYAVPVTAAVDAAAVPAGTLHLRLAPTISMH